MLLHLGGNMDFLNKYSVTARLFGAFSSMAAITLLLGGLSLVLINSIGNDGEHVGAGLAPLGDAAMEIKLTAVNAHLELEEILSGVENKDIENVWAQLEESRWYANAIVNGGTNDEGTFLPTDSDFVKARVAEVNELMDKFIKAANVRYDLTKNSSSTGSGTDQKFDEVYEAIQGGISGLVTTAGGT